MNNLTMYIIANAAIGTGMSGSDRIFIECARRWADYGNNINVIVWEDGYRLCVKNNLNNVNPVRGKPLQVAAAITPKAGERTSNGVNYIVWKAERYKKLGFTLFYILRVIKSCLHILRIRTSAAGKVVIYSASDFWMDSLPAWLMKMRNRGANWIAGFYLFMPPPWDKDFPYKGKKIIIGILYWLTQLPVYHLIKRSADMVFVTSEPYIDKFITSKRTRGKIIAIHGGIDVRIIQSVPEPAEKTYDAVFLGRFHPQKGVLELIDIWKQVCTIKKDAILVIIGEGDLEDEMRNRIKQYDLINNVKIYGFTDGREKIKIFKDSKIALYPATLDHWSMAPVEAMICGLPLVTFDMPVVKTIDLKGALCVPCYNLKSFADCIINLLEDKRLYDIEKAKAVEWAMRWDWDNRARDIYKAMEAI